MCCMIHKYTQSTYETCLACCLLQAVDRINTVKISQKLELECITYSLTYSKDDFVIGHLEFIAKNYNVAITRMVDYRSFYNYLSKMHSSPNIHNAVQKIDLHVVDQCIDKKPIVYVDAYYLFNVYHYPHFITILRKSGNKYTIFDTWDGKEKVIESQVLAKSISSLRSHIRFSPQLIIVE